MAEYIEREALTKLVKTKRLTFVSYKRSEAEAVREAVQAQGRAFREAVDECPAADVVEVRHGEWQAWENYPTIYGIDTLFVCSSCTAKYTEKSRYCPFCGAKMDGDGALEVV